MSKRTDSPKGTGIEGEPATLFADSDVGSSPGLAKPSEDSLPPVRWDEAAFSKVKLMCSYGGRILPRPHDHQLRYVGGDSRIVVVPRNVTFADLMTKLAKMFGASVAIKYQLPCEDLDSLISVTSGEDLEIMMDENDRLQQGSRIYGAGSSSSMPGGSTRLRLFLFPTKIERSQTTSLSEMLERTQSREKIFVDILNGMPPLPRVRSESSSIISENPDYLFGQDALEEWAAAASYGAGAVLSSASAAVTSTSSLEKPPDLLGHGSSGFPIIFGSLVHHHEASFAPGSALQTGYLFGSSSSGHPAVISILSTAAAPADSKDFAMPTMQVTVENGHLKSVQENDMESRQEQHLSLNDTPDAVTRGSKQLSETGTIHSLPCEPVLDEGITRQRQAITTMPIYDEDDQHALPAPPCVEQARALKIDDRRDFAVEETLMVQKAAKLEIGTQAVEMGIPCDVSAAAPVRPIVASQPKIVTKAPPTPVSAATNAEAPAIVSAPLSTTMMQKRDNAPHFQANNLYQQHQLFQEGAVELDSSVHITQGLGIQPPPVLTHIPVVNPTPGTAGTSVGVIAPPVPVGAAKPVAVGAQQMMGGPRFPIQSIRTGPMHAQLPLVVTSPPPAVITTTTPQSLDQGTIPSRVQQVPRDPAYHHFQRAVSPSVPAVTNPKEVLYQYGTPVIGHAVSAMPLRYHGHSALQQVPSTTPSTLQQVASGMVSNIHARPVSSLPGQYYYVVEQPKVTVGNVYFAQDGIGVPPQARPLTVAGSNPFMDNLRPPLTPADTPVVGVQASSENNPN